MQLCLMPDQGDPGRARQGHLGAVSGEPRWGPGSPVPLHTRLLFHLFFLLPDSVSLFNFVLLSLSLTMPPYMWEGVVWQRVVFAPSLFPKQCRVTATYTALTLYEVFQACAA